MILQQSISFLSLLARNPITFLQINFGLIGSDDTLTSRQHFEVALHQALLTHPASALGIPDPLHRTLIQESADDEIIIQESNHGNGDFQNYIDDDDEPTSMPYPFCGIPIRPYYKELARRLFTLSKAKSRIAKPKRHSIETPERYFLVEASKLGFKELLNPSIKSLPGIHLIKPTPSSMYEWLKETRPETILLLLGMRQTIGTDIRCLLPPSRKVLLEAASVPHRRGQGNKLSVAAKARAKHAHRGKEKFFGIVMGGPEKQSQETERIVKDILDHAVWMNIHAFGGTNSQPVLEARLETGYGARWTADWTEPWNPTYVQFRGFLEPQMPDGHERGWKH